MLYMERFYVIMTSSNKFQAEYLNAKTLRSVDEVNVALTEPNPPNPLVAEMVADSPSLELTPDPRFKNLPVNHKYSTVHVPTNVYEKCR